MVVLMEDIMLEIELHKRFYNQAFFERKCGRGSPYSDFCFLKIKTQIRVCGDLNLGGCVVHPLP
jgi:hypothetical protein